MLAKKPLWILGVTRGHNAGVCLLKDGEIVFSIEEERLSRMKYDGAPFAAMVKVLEYTDRLDYIAVAHTQPLKEMQGVDFSGDDPYTALARKLRLIDPIIINTNEEGMHPQVIDYGQQHHKLHAACAFYRSGFEDAVAVVVDGAGTYIHMEIDGDSHVMWETESIFDCEYPSTFNTVYKHIGSRGPSQSGIQWQPTDNPEESGDCEHVITELAGIVKAYEAVTKYCGFQEIEAGKTMGLFPYGKPNPKIPSIFDRTTIYPVVNRNLITPTYPSGAMVNHRMFEELFAGDDADDVTLLQNRRDMAYAVQTQTQEQVLRLILKAVEMTGKRNVVLSGGYGLNCVANYWYLQYLNNMGIKLYVEPISNDGGTAIGAALYHYRRLTGSTKVSPRADCLYLGPKYNYSDEDIRAIVGEEYEIADANYEDVVELLRAKNIVAMFQGRSENGPRALGNRSIIFDPTFADGKDFVNSVKRREYFRPFAGTILKEHARDWFDMRGLEESPTMMYAVNCKEGVADKVPSVIHVDGTCRIQTVTEEQNEHFYNLISTFYDQTGIPLLFNTSFNLGGEPLVETLEDAVRTLTVSDINYLYLPEYGKLITIMGNKR